MKPEYTPVVTILSKRGGMLRVSAVTGGIEPAVSLELRKGTDPFSKPEGKIVIGTDLLSGVMMALAQAGDIATGFDSSEPTDG